MSESCSPTIPHDGEHLTAEAAGLFFDSKNRITHDTLVFLCPPAQRCGLGVKSKPCSTATRSPYRRPRRHNLPEQLNAVLDCFQKVSKRF